MALSSTMILVSWRIWVAPQVPQLHALGHLDSAIPDLTPFLGFPTSPIRPATTSGGRDRCRIAFAHLLAGRLFDTTPQPGS